MSCITKILETKGDKPILVNKTNEIAVEGGGIYKGYEYIITFTNFGHRCGYVAIPVEHPLHTSKEEYPEYEVHGGVTFFQESRLDEFVEGHQCTDKWIGFDAAHCNDEKCISTIEKYFGESDFTIMLKANDLVFNEKFPKYTTHRSFAYMKNECRLLIQQLIKEAA